MMITLNELLAKTPELQSFDAINRWQIKFAAAGASDEFSALLLGEEVEVSLNLDLAVKHMTNTSFMSKDSKRFIEESFNPENLGKTTEDLCREFDLDLETIKAEQYTEAFRNYTATVKDSDLELTRTKTVLLTHRVLQELLIAQPLTALQHIRALHTSPVLFVQDGVRALQSGEAVEDGEIKIEIGEPVDITSFMQKKTGDIVDAEFD